MKLPIKQQTHLHPRPIPSVAHAEASGSPPKYVTTQGRRTDAERHRLTKSGLPEDEFANADVQFFSQLLAPSMADDDSPSAYSGPDFTANEPQADVPVQLIDELTQRLPGDSREPLSMTLLMPNLGKVQVYACRRDNSWSIGLGFARKGMLARLQPRAGACEDALAQALGLDVDLSMHEAMDI